MAPYPRGVTTTAGSLPARRLVEAAERDVGATARASHASVPATCDALLGAVRRHVRAAGGALVVMDPHTLLFTTGAVADLPAPTCHPFFSTEVDPATARSFARNAAASAGASSVGPDSDDPLVRRVLLPHGFAAEARVVCRTRAMPWAGLSLWRRPGDGGFDRTDEAVLDAVAPVVATAVRDAVVASLRQSGGDDTAVLILDADGAVEASDDARRLLPEIDDPHLTEYRHLDHLRSLAASDAAFSTVLAAGGRWLAAHGTPLGAGRVAVVLAAASPGDLFGTVVAGAGLTPREVEVLRLLCRGLSDAELARSLGVSLHTARDHVLAVRAKLGARSRGEVAARVFSGHYLGRFVGSASIRHAHEA